MFSYDSNFRFPMSLSKGYLEIGDLRCQDLKLEIIGFWDFPDFNFFDDKSIIRYKYFTRADFYDCSRKMAQTAGGNVSDPPWFCQTATFIHELSSWMVGRPYWNSHSEGCDQQIKHIPKMITFDMNSYPEWSDARTEILILKVDPSLYKDFEKRWL